MKRILILLAAAAIALCSCTQKGFTIIGDIEGLDEGDINLLDAYGHTITSAVVQDGKFRFEGTVDKPCLAYINNVLGVRYPIDIPVMLENARIRVTGNAANQHIEIKGTKVNEDMVAYKMAKDALAPDDVDGYVNLIKSTFEENSDNILGALLLTSLFGYVSDEEFLEYCDRVPDMFFEDEMYSHYRDLSRIRVDTAVGKGFVDIELDDKDGNTVKLSDVVKENKATALIFCASWAREVSTFLKQYMETCSPYKDKGLTSYVVSLDSNTDQWEQCIKEFNIFGHTFCDGYNKSKAESDKYGIDGMPRIILIDQKGNIVARGRSVSEIADVLGQIFKN